jgi:hypothetical protein
MRQGDVGRPSGPDGGLLVSGDLVANPEVVATDRLVGLHEDEVMARVGRSAGTHEQL